MCGNHLTFNPSPSPGVMAYPKSDGYKDLKSVLAQQGQLSVQTVFHLVKKTAERLDDIHSKGFFSGKMDMSTIETQGVKVKTVLKGDFGVSRPTVFLW